MAKKKYDYRAVQAHKRNQQKIADAKAKQRNKEFIEQYGKQILIGVAALIVVIVAIWLGCKWFVGPGGSIPNWFGTLRNVEENWIVTNTGTTSKPKYFKLAEFEAPEGYTLDPEYNGSTDTLNMTQYYNADDETAPVSAMYVSGVRNVTAEGQLNSILAYYPENTGAKQATIAGHDVHYAYIITDTTVDQTDEAGNVLPTPEEEKTGASFLCMYVDSVQDSCVLVMLNTAEALKSEVVTEEVLLAEAEKFLPLLTVEK